MFKEYREHLAPGANCAFHFGILSAVSVGAWLFLLIVAVRRVGMGTEPCKTVLTIVMLAGLEAALIYLVGVISAIATGIADAAGLLKEEFGDRLGIVGVAVFFAGLVGGILVCAFGRKVRKEELREEAGGCK